MCTDVFLAARRLSGDSKWIIFCRYCKCMEKAIQRLQHVCVYLMNWLYYFKGQKARTMYCKEQWKWFLCCHIVK